MRTLDPRVKLFFVTAAASLALLYKDTVQMLVLSAAVFIGAVLLGADLRSFFARLRRFLALIAGIAVLQAVFFRTGEPVIGLGNFPLLTQDGLSRGITTGMRLFVILCSASVMASENSRRVLQGLIQMRVPYMLCFMASTALRFLPSFSQDFSDALVSMQLRGIELRKVPARKRLKVFSSLLLPVIAGAVVKSQDLAAAMETRGFGAMKTRTSYDELQMRAADWIALILLALAFSAAVFAAMMGR